MNINAGNINAAGLEFDTTGYVINGTGAGNTLTLMGNHTVNVVNATDTATVNAPLAGTVGLAKIGSGTLVLGGTNTFTGGVTIASGNLKISSDANLGDASNGITLGGGTLTPLGNLTLGAVGTTGRTLSGSGTLAVATNNTLTFNGVVTAGTLTLSGTGTVAIANTAGLDNNGVASNSVAGVNFGAAGGTISAPGEALTGNNLGLLTVGGATVPTNVTGAATINANVNFATGSTNTFNVANAASTLTITGDTTGSGVLAKTGSGTARSSRYWPKQPRRTNRHYSTGNGWSNSSRWRHYCSR